MSEPEVICEVVYTNSKGRETVESFDETDENHGWAKLYWATSPNMMAMRGQRSWQYRERTVSDADR